MLSFRKVPADVGCEQQCLLLSSQTRWTKGVTKVYRMSDFEQDLAQSHGHMSPAKAGSMEVVYGRSPFASSRQGATKVRRLMPYALYQILPRIAFMIYSFWLD
jgi:hypothetical protein